MGLELAEKLGWAAPDWLIYPTGGGTGLLGIWKAYRELAALGWVNSQLPRFVAVQAEGCAPVVKAWAENAAVTTPWENPVTQAAGLRVPSPFAGRQILEVLRESDGCALALPEAAIVEAQKLLARFEGIWTALEGAASLAALLRLKDEGSLDHDEKIVLLLTGAGIKNQPPPLPPPVDLTGPDATLLARIRAMLGPPHHSPPHPPLSPLEGGEDSA